MGVMVRKDELQAKLIEKGQKEGAVSAADILALLPDAENNVEFLDQVIETLLEASIEVVIDSESEMVQIGRAHV